MHCPRCGTPNEPGDRFCSSCGTALAKAEPKPKRSWRQRLGDLVGTDRRTRLITGATVAALAIAVGAFIALSDDEETIPRDAYTIAADQMCIAAKRQIVAVERAGLQGKAPDSSARDLLPVVAEWRSDFDALKVPSDRLEEARALDAALQEVEARIGALARVATEGNRTALLARAKEAEEASAGVEEAVSDLGLSHCSRLAIGFTQD
ncbi:MAG TPA: zinc-ribbon domain-containing protein [Solirubrobacterales bacterium]|nr:zinc-ribbon domain-containing protein [Solirubrobacterales bacterium]